MKLITKRTFKATPPELWEIIHDPANMPAWNPKCVWCEVDGTGTAGPRFLVTYEMRGKQSDAEGEVVASEEQRRIHFRYTYEDAAKLGTVDEVFELKPKGDRQTEVVQIVDFSNSTLPRWVKWLIGFIGRFGKEQGIGPMDGIQALLPTDDR